MSIRFVQYDPVPHDELTEVHRDDVLHGYIIKNFDTNEYQYYRIDAYHNGPLHRDANYHSLKCKVLDSD